MREPTPFELNQLAHLYDPQKAHEYYLLNRKLKGRKPAQATFNKSSTSSGSKDPRTGKTMDAIMKEARAKKRAELSEQINRLEGRLVKLEAMIKAKIQEEASENRKSTADKNRAAKEADKPKTAAEKAEAARENEKYRDKNQQKLKNQAKDSSGGSSSSKSDSTSSGPSVADLKSLATRVKGQIAVAKQKLAAL